MTIIDFQFAGSCFAYIDPNAGGWLFQLLFPVFIAIAGAWLTLRTKVHALCKRLFGRKNKESDDHQ